MREVFEFSSVEDFWRTWYYIPKPKYVILLSIASSVTLLSFREVLFDGQNKVLGRKIDAFSLFKRGIRPEWEDPQNSKASEWSTTGPFDMDVDILWENMVLALIGQVIEEGNEICGCRVVDKCKRGKSTRPVYRLELWLKPNIDKKIAEGIKVRLLEALADGDPDILPLLPPFEYKMR